ncbi:tyrosine-type recombinase/integrase [Actinoplanes sp. RD1]|uniref:tyrosine-type recombinase/integrase n=1 Tax=Actinoplanes sp. RD1 TaxID=3064538 RepID=UPI00274071F5|nr:site-specific integrase [Actinoplanes sp. RD1]
MAADPGLVAVARGLLAQLGVSVADLQLAQPQTAVTVNDYLPRVRAAASTSSNRTYGSYWNRMSAAWGERPVASIAATDVEAFQRRCARTSRQRRNGRGGRQAGENAVAAARAFFSRAIADGLIATGASPAHQVAKPRRLPSPRRALTPDEITEINQVARSSGNDAVLDALLLRLHTETACRRGGALALRLMDLDTARGLVRLREKGETLRWQPVTLALAERLADHAASRGAVAPADGLLRYRDGRALTSRRYDHLWKRLGDRLPWVAAQSISTHWLRHTTLTWVERNFGYGIARAYAGHTDNTGPATTTYIKADLQAVATALAALTGQPHPLAGSLDDLGMWGTPAARGFKPT